MNPPAPLALGGIILLCALALPALRRPAWLLAICRLQGLALAAAAGFAGYLQQAIQLYLTGGVVLGLNVILLPRLLQQANSSPAAAPLAAPPMLLAGGGIVVLAVAIMAVPRGLASPGLALPLAALLLGVLRLVTQRGGAGQAAGVLCIGNALVLAAVMLPGLPFVPEFAAALAALSLTFAWLAPQLPPSGRAEGG